MSDTLRSGLIRLAFANPELREELLPLIEKEARAKVTPRKEHKPGDVWRTEQGKFRAISPSGSAKSFDNSDEAKTHAGKGGGKSEKKDDGAATAEARKKKMQGIVSRLPKEKRQEVLEIVNKKGAELEPREVAELKEKAKSLADKGAKSRMSPAERKQKFLQMMDGSKYESPAAFEAAQKRIMKMSPGDFETMVFALADEEPGAEGGGKTASLLDGLIRIAYANPELRGDLLPLITKEAADYKKYVEKKQRRGERPMSKEDWQKRQDPTSATFEGGTGSSTAQYGKKPSKELRKDYDVMTSTTSRQLLEQAEKEHEEVSAASRKQQDERAKRKKEKGEKMAPKKKASSTLRSGLIRLAYANPSLRPTLLPLIEKHAGEMDAELEEDADPTSHDQNLPEHYYFNKGAAKGESVEAILKQFASPKSKDQNKPESYYGLAPKGKQAAKEKNDYSPDTGETGKLRDDLVKALKKKGLEVEEGSSANTLYIDGEKVAIHGPHLEGEHVKEWVRKPSRKEWLDEAVKLLGKKASVKMPSGSGATNAAYLRQSPLKDKILRTVAKQYGVSVSEIEGELTDPDAAALYEYIGSDRALQLQVRREFLYAGL